MRILRSSWVLLTNAIVIYISYSSVKQVALLNHLLEQDSRNKTLWLHFALRATIPFLGILFEFLGWRLAKWVNIGYFLFLGIAYSAAGVWNWPDHHAVIALFFGLAALAVAGLSWLFYRRPHSTPATPLSQ
jgi:hypothetical protein